MTNKKGFTLIELIAVIVILALIAMIVFPAVNSVIKNAKEKTYKDQVAIIIKAAKQCSYEYSIILPEEVNDSTATIPINCLTTGCDYKGQKINGGFLGEDEIKNPKNSKPFSGVIKITYKSEYNQYEYEYVE